jgi:hypothetical protein
MFRLSLLALAISAALLLPSVALALVSIDSFSGGSFLLEDTTGESGVERSNQSGVPGVLGGTRETSLDLFLGLLATAQVDSGLFSVSHDGRGATASLTYDGLADGTVGIFPGLGGIDLSVGGEDRIVLDLISVSGGLDIGVTLWDSTSTDSVLLTPIQSAGDQVFLFSSFAHIDFTDIRAIEIDFHMGPNDSFSIGSIAAVAVIPEPSTALLFAVGLVGLAVRRKRPIDGSP